MSSVDDNGLTVGFPDGCERSLNRIHLASDGVSPFNKNSMWYPCSRILASGGANIESLPSDWVNIGNTIR